MLDTLSLSVSVALPDSCEARAYGAGGLILKFLDRSRLLDARRERFNIASIIIYNYTLAAYRIDGLDPEQVCRHCIAERVFEAIGLPIMLYARDGFVEFVVNLYGRDYIDKWDRMP
jgi:hypothetical protein